MPKKAVCFISGFLIPSLNEERFGNNLKWIDRKNTIFQIEWIHKRGPTWTEREADVFAEWDKKKGHYQPSDQTYYSKSKQRFRSLLYKLTKQGYLKKLKSDEKFKMVYKIVHEKKIKRKISTSCDSSESELSNEGYDRSEEVAEPDEHRMISNDKIINILEDHPYSCTNQLQSSSSDIEKEQGTDCLYVEIQAAAPFYESLKIGKKVLTLKNHPCNELIHTPTVMTDGRHAYNPTECLMFDEEITTEVPLLQVPVLPPGDYLSISSVNLNKYIEERAVRNSSFGITPTLNESKVEGISDAFHYDPDFRDVADIYAFCMQDTEDN